MNKAMIQLDGSGWDISATKEAEKLKLSILKEASTIKVVEDKADEALALAACSNLGSFRRQLEATKKAVKAPVIALGRKIEAIAESFGEEVDSEERRIKGILGGYQLKLDQERRKIEQEAERKRIEAQKALEAAEAARVLAERKQTLLSETRAEKLEEKAIEARVEVMQLAQLAENTKVRGGSMVWSFEVMSLDELYMERPDLVKLEAKTREINEAMKRLEDQGKPVAIHGLRCFQIPRINIR